MWRTLLAVVLGITVNGLTKSTKHSVRSAPSLLQQLLDSTTSTVENNSINLPSNHQPQINPSSTALTTKTLLPEEPLSPPLQTLPSNITNGEIYKVFNRYLWEMAQNGSNKLKLQLDQDVNLRNNLQLCAEYIQWSIKQLIQTYEQEWKDIRSINVVDEENKVLGAQREFVNWLKVRSTLHFNKNISNYNFAISITKLVDPHTYNNSIENNDDDDSTNTEELNLFRFKKSDPISESFRFGGKGGKGGKGGTKNHFSTETDIDAFYKELSEDKSFKNDGNDHVFENMIDRNMATRINVIKSYKRALALNSMLDQEKDLALSAVNDLSIVTDSRVKDLALKSWLETPLCNGYNTLTGLPASRICIFNFGAVQTERGGDLQQIYKVPMAIRVQKLSKLNR